MDSALLFHNIFSLILLDFKVSNPASLKMKHWTEQRNTAHYFPQHMRKVCFQTGCYATLGRTSSKV